MNRIQKKNSLHNTTNRWKNDKKYPWQYNYLVKCPCLTHYHTMQHFDTLKIYSCGEHCEKRRNCFQQAISPFSHNVLYPIWHLLFISNAL